MAITTNYGNYAYVNKAVEKEGLNQKKEDPVVKDNERNGAAVYEKQSDNNDKATYEIAKKSPADRAAIIQQMKAAEEEQRNNLISIVQKTLAGQTNAYGKATGDSLWKRFAGGDFKVDPFTRAQAQKDISEDGYYGVKKTSQRLFDFAQALAGDDVEKMKEMQKAMEKGFKKAEKTWGGELPSICQETIDAANKLFEEYYNSKDAAI